MARFVFTTLSERQTVFRSAPSGFPYSISKDTPFEVTDKKDIEFFESKPGRFKKLTAVSRKPKKDTRSEDTKLEDELSVLPGVSAKTAKGITEIFPTKKQLGDALELGYKDIDSFPEKQVETIKKHFEVNR